MDPTNRQLETVVVGDTPDAWRAAGFDVDGHGHLVLGSTTIALSGSGAGFEAWRIQSVEHDVDGVRTAGEIEGAGAGDELSGSGRDHPNGICRIDHVVVRTGDHDRTVEALTAAGLDERDQRATEAYGSPMRQSFFWAGDAIIEVVGPGHGEATTDEPASIFGLALASDDLDATAAFLGELLATPKDAVQPGRRIAGLRGAQVGISVPVAVMSPHVRT